MTRDELHDLIYSDKAAIELALVADDAALAARCSAIAPAVPTPRRMSYLGLANSVTGIGPDATRRLITSIRAVASQDVLIDEIQRNLRDANAGVDVSDPAVSVMLAQFVALTEAGTVPTGLTAEDAAAIFALGMARPTFTPEEVGAAR